MKKAGFVLAAVLALTLLLTGCDGFKFSFTSFGGNTTIEVNNAEDGDTGESGAISVWGGKVAAVGSELDKGALKIDFAEATVIHNNDESMDDVIIGDVAASVTVGVGEQAEVALDEGDYVLQVTAVGETNGKVTVSFR